MKKRRAIKNVFISFAYTQVFKNLRAPLAILILTLALIPWSSGASESNRDWIVVSGHYSQYKTANGKLPSQSHPAPSADVDVAIRVLGPLNLLGSLTNTVEPDRNDPNITPFRIRTTGAGLKLDLPGFFFLGSKGRSFFDWGKSRPISTSLFAEAVNLELKDLLNTTTAQQTAGRFGIGLDLFPWTQLSHFTLRWMYLNSANTGYWVYSFGGGITF